MVERVDVITERVGHQGPTPFIQVALRWFQPLATKQIRKQHELPRKLAQAAVPIVPVAYLSAIYLRTAIAAAAGLLVFLIYLGASWGDPDPALLVAFLVSPMLLGALTYSYGLLRPELEISARRRDVEGNLPFALNFLAALAAAGVVPDQLFGALGVQKVYGQVAHEASMIYRDTKLFSRDLVDAMRTAARRSPSKQFEEFLNGAVNTITSGGDLKTYFLAKSEHYSTEAHRKQRAFLESMGVMAESYVVVGAAAPLFLIVIMSVMFLLSSGGDPTLYLNIITLGALPVIHGMFIYILRNMRAD